MVVDFGGVAVAELDPRHPSVSVVDGSFDDVEVFQLFEDPDHRAHGQPGAQIDVRRSVGPGRKRRRRVTPRCPVRSPGQKSHRLLTPGSFFAGIFP